MLQSLSNENPENILSMKPKIRDTLRDTLEEILKGNVGIDDLTKSKFELDLQNFVNTCSETNLLEQMGSEIKIIIDKLKDQTMNKVSADQEKAPDIIKDDDEVKICINENPPTRGLGWPRHNLNSVVVEPFLC